METLSIDLALIEALDLDSFFSLSAVGDLLSEVSLEAGLASLTGAAAAFSAGGGGSSLLGPQFVLPNPQLFQTLTAQTLRVEKSDEAFRKRIF